VAAHVNYLVSRGILEYEQGLVRATAQHSV
jgi:hypothetical protein